MELHVQQGFRAAMPNQKWTTDITDIWTKEGWLYLAVVMDLYSRAIVGLAMNRCMTQHFASAALTMGLFRRQFPKNPIIHSYRGSQYGSNRYQRVLRINRLRCSMGHRASGYDNAVMESFFHPRNVQLVYRERDDMRHKAQSRIFEYIETCDNW